MSTDEGGRCTHSDGDRRDGEGATVLVNAALADGSLATRAAPLLLDRLLLSPSADAATEAASRPECVALQLALAAHPEVKSRQCNKILLNGGVSLRAPRTAPKAKGGLWRTAGGDGGDSKTFVRLVQL